MSNFSTDWEESYVGGSPDAEAKLIAKWAKQIQEVQFRLRDRSKAAIIRRAFHAKMLAGVANAEFRIVDQLPPHLEVGFFQPGKVYQATVRLSNANGGIRPDTKGDFRGVAIRVATGDTTVTDYLLTNGPASHARDAKQFMLVAWAGAGSRIWALPRLLFGLGPAELSRVAKTLLRGTRRTVDSLATEQFWSRGAYKWGQCAVRFTVQPAPGTTAETPGYRSPNYLREEFVQRLKRGPITYDFKVQLYTGTTTPIEDGAVQWDSPFIKVAELVIPQQDLTLAANRQREAAIDDLEFSPWNTANDFRPLGSLNRARKQVYQSSAHYRAGRSAFFKRGLFAKFIVWSLDVFWTAVNRTGFYWHQAPGALIGVTNLDVLREHLRERNLHDTEIRERVPKPDPAIHTLPSKVLRARQVDGTYNDLSNPQMGAVNTRFGRNMPPLPNPESTLLDPNPRDVSLKLLRREEFIPATSLNLLAAAWINFMVHGWFDHIRHKPGAGQNIEVPLANDDPWQDRPMKVARTAPDVPPDEVLAKRHEILKNEDDYTNLNLLAFKNRISHWWDGSQIYGNKPEITRQIRLFDPAHPESSDVLPDGKICILPNGLLPKDPDVKFEPNVPDEGIDLAGFNNNYWLGLSLLHTIFAREHNAIIDRLKAEFPTWSGEQLFETARLIIAALIAKIHTVEWTPAIVAHPSLRISMDANWWGAVGQDLQNLLPRQSDSEALDGIMGSPTNHHAAPYALTEEFTTVYKLHPLIPDDYVIHSHVDDRVLAEKSFHEIEGRYTRKVCHEFSLADLFYSFGVSHPGAVTLHNYPRHLMEFVSLSEGTRDTATADVLRERERGVPRYNDFREHLRMPRIRSFEEMTANPAWARQLKEVYGNVDRVDTMVGMLAETPPPGFGFSDTAFRIFILMASRRLKSDRFFTTDWRPEIYTKFGMDWVRDNDMKTVILRHLPELGPALHRISNTFAPWNRVGPQCSVKSRIITETINANDRPLRFYNRLARFASYLSRRSS